MQGRGFVYVTYESGSASSITKLGSRSKKYEVTVPTKSGSGLCNEMNEDLAPQPFVRGLKNRRNKYYKQHIL
jgi:hypothetical protein